MSRKNLLRGTSILVAWALALVSCDAGTKSADTSDPLTTNFNVNLSSLIEATGGKPDSIVAEIKTDDGRAEKVVLYPDRISQSGLIQFPVEAAEGSRVEVSYLVWRADAVIGAGSVKWLSGEPLSVPRPDLSPSISFQGLVAKELILRRHDSAWFHLESADPENALALVALDWNGDGTPDDSLVPSGTDSLKASWSRSGSYRVVATIRDRSGLLGRDTLRVLVVDGARVALDPDTLVSIGDSVDLRVTLDLDTSSQSAGIRLAWSGLGTGSDTTGVLASRRVAWNQAGTYHPRVQVVDAYGTAATDSVHLEVATDPVRLDLSRLPVQVDLGSVALLAVAGTQEFGQIVSWSMDFDGDTASGWDTTLAGPPSGVSHLFPSTGIFRILVQAFDDDGNRTVASRELTVGSSNASQVLRRESRPDTTISVNDSAEIRFLRNFPAGTESQARVEWRIDGGPIVSESVALRKTFAWNEVGLHSVAWRVAMPSGSTLWDTVRVDVVRGTPVLLELKVLGSGVGLPFYFSAKVDPVFGSIVRSRWDFGNDGRWDDSVANPETQISRSFATSTPVAVRFQATDDDGNSVDTTFSVSPSNATPKFGVVDFAESKVGVQIAAVLRATFTDPDGASDLATLSVDWEGDDVWDTVRTVTGLGSDEIRHTWGTQGLRTVRVRIADRSGRSTVDSARIDVRANAPRILSFGDYKGRTKARMGDTLWFVAFIADSSLPTDLDSIRWRRDGLSDTVISLRNTSGQEARLAVARRDTGLHTITAIVRDQIGNSDSATASWTIETSPPYVQARLRDSILAARDTVTLHLDSLRPGILGGGISKVEWSFKNSGAWITIPLPAAGKSTLLSLPTTGDLAWFLLVRATQDNGETFVDTVRSELLPSFVDKRDGTVYPYLTVGTTTWMARNLSWKPSLDDPVESSCAGNNQCDPLGRLYTIPVPLRDEPSSTGAPHSVSVCPEGWRLPTDLEFNELIDSGRARHPDLSYGQILRARSGWTSPLPSQPDPLRFGALPTLAIAAEQTTAWWTFSPQPYPDPKSETPPYPNQMNQSVRVLGNDDLGHANKYWPSHGASVRCVRLKELVIDSSWKPAAENFDSSWMPILMLRGLAPTASTPVTIRATLDGRSVETTMVPTGHAIPWTTLPQLPFTRVGTFELRLDVSQDDATYTETIPMVITAPE